MMSQEHNNPQWVPHGWSGFLYNLLWKIFGNPHDHPRLMNWIFGPDAFNGVTVRHLERGAIMRLDYRDYIAREILENGSYEEQSLRLSLSLLESGGGFIDIGSNVGLYSIPAATISGVSVVAVDGSVAALSRLWENRRLSGVDIVLVASLVGEETGIGKLIIPCISNLGSARLADSGQEFHPVLNCAAFVTLNSLFDLAGDNRINLLKIDVEGMEWEVVKSFDWTRTDRPKNVIVELWSDNTGAQRTFDHLVAAGYLAYTVDNRPLTKLIDVAESNIWFREPGTIGG